MAELSALERLQPALLDRLIDEAPDKREETRESRLLNARQLRAAVLRDLAWLFNASRPADNSFDLAPRARRSVLNFGLPPLSGLRASSLDRQTLASGIRQAILDFEPRIDSASLQVEVLDDGRPLERHNQIEVSIRGQLWAQPVPLELLLHTAVDLETGQVQIQDKTF